ncbi:hypothetical protein OS127_02815 [Corynebacterium sp. P6129]|uniref:glycine-rich domain-containing protein n=1 Tax=Corynebacterium antarcticum TaxID=2800405 RepID=UPI002260F1E7|nr:hypothetical protein [Corynebacterium antarcticum]MCX7491461.1 hypothetical protein [Corynebacterium antarcticum]
MIKVDGAPIKQVIFNGQNIKEVWVDNVRVFSSRRLEVHEYATTGLHTLTVPDWADRIDYVIFAGGGGGAGGNRHPLGGHCSAGDAGSAKLGTIQDAGALRRAEKISVNVGAGGEGGEGGSAGTDSPNRGANGADSSIVLRESSGASVQEVIQPGGDGGYTAGSTEGSSKVFRGVSKTYVGIVDQGQDLEPPAGRNRGGDGGAFTTARRGTGTAGKRGGDGWVKIAFSSGY